MSKRAGEMWRAMNNQKRAVYEKSAQNAMKAHSAAMEEFQETWGRQEPKPKSLTKSHKKKKTAEVEVWEDDWKSEDEAAVPTAPAVNKRAGPGRSHSRRVKPQLGDGADDDADCIVLDEGPPTKQAKTESAASATAQPAPAPVPPPPFAAAAALDEAAAAKGESQLCKICFAEPLSCALLNCGHVAVCEACAKQLIDRGAPCPICQQPIHGKLKVFLA